MESGVWLEGEIRPSFFDSRFEQMERTYLSPGVQRVFYEHQAKDVERLIKPGTVVLDVGCGAQMRYAKDPEATHIGLDPSFQSIARNKADILICASADRLPIQDKSIDLVVCFYSLHHMVGANRKISRQKVFGAFAEFGRILKRGGKILVFEVTLAGPLYLVEKAVWQTFRAVLGSKMDMHFYSIRALQDIALQALSGKRLQLTVTKYHTPAFYLFSPALALPNLRIPRILYPLSPIAMQWEIV
jgi:ubiquinone/menaquinone biosynthesis C-methylase UbiE